MIFAMDGGLWLHRHLWRGRRMAHLVSTNRALLLEYGAAAGIRTMVILPRGKVSTAQLVQPLANGATVLAIDGDFDACMAIVKRLAEEEGVYLANSMNSLRIEGQKTVSIEMVQQFDWEVPDWVVIPGGNLGNVSALGAGFLMMKEIGVIQKLPRICVAQAQAAIPLYTAYKNGFETFAPMVPHMMTVLATNGRP